MFSLCQGASVYISTLSLTAIALDRLKLMTHLTARWITAPRNSDAVTRVPVCCWSPFSGAQIPASCVVVYDWLIPQ